MMEGEDRGVMHPVSPLWCPSGALIQACPGVPLMVVQRCI